MDLGQIQLTSQDLWRSALAAGGLAALALGLLARTLSRARFAQLRWPLAGAAALFWVGLAAVMYGVFWEAYYRYFMPAAGALAGTLLAAPLGAGLALLFHALALRLPGNPVVTFGLLNGLEAWLEHLWGIYVFKILAVPLLQGVSPASVLAFAFPEYVLYGCAICLLARLFAWAWRRGRPART